MGAQSLVERVQGVVGEELRSVVRYTGENLGLEREPLYMRDDVRARTDDYDLALARHSMKYGEESSNKLGERIDASTHFATIRVYDSVIILYFPHDETRRTVITIDLTGLTHLPEVTEAAADELYPDALIERENSNMKTD